MGRVVIFFRWGIWLRSPKELALLNTQDARSDVLAQVSRAVRSGWPKSWPWTVAILLPLLGVVTAYSLWTREPNWWLFAAVILGGFVLDAWLHRDGAQKKLREVLRSHGIILCINCGYDLRGQTGEPVCP
jgi:hypothetical protein